MCRHQGWGAGWGGFFLTSGCSLPPPPCWLAQCLGLQWVQEGMGLQGKGRAGGSSCLGGGPHIASMPRGGPSRSTSPESRCIAGPGASSPPFRVLVSMAAGDSQNDLPKVMAQILGMGGVSLGGPTRQPAPGSRRQRLVEEEARGLRQVVRSGGLPGAAHEEGSASRAWPPREASFPVPPGGGSKRPQPGPSMEPPEAAAAASCLRGSCFWEGQLHSLWGLGPPSSQSWEEAGLGGAWRGGKGNRPSAPFRAPQPKQGWPPAGPSLVRSSHRAQDPEVHTHSHTHSNGNVHTPLHSDLVLKHTCGNWVTISTAGARQGSSSGSWTSRHLPPPQPQPLT